MLLFVVHRRDPKSLVKPPKDGVETDDYKLKLKEKTPTASRHIFLIRHGQYNLKGEIDEKQYLTELGKYNTTQFCIHSM